MLTLKYFRFCSVCHNLHPPCSPGGQSPPHGDSPLSDFLQLRPLTLLSYLCSCSLPPFRWDYRPHVSHTDLETLFEDRTQLFLVTLRSDLTKRLTARPTFVRPAAGFRTFYRTLWAPVLLLGGPDPRCHPQRCPFHPLIETHDCGHLPAPTPLRVRPHSVCLSRPRTAKVASPGVTVQPC